MLKTTLWEDTATEVFDEKEHGLTEEVLANTDVLVFWNHMLQEEFSDDVAERVRRHVLAGMGLVVLHSGHYSKIMRKLLGTSMTLRWRHGDRESQGFYILRSSAG